MPDLSFADIKAAFCTAEKSIKDCENLTGQLPQGAVNELRYAALHLIDYLNSSDQEELNKYYRHCKRAKYDALELSVIMLRHQADCKLADYQGNEDIISSVLGEDFKKILQNRKKINNLLKDANASKENREDYLDKIQETIPLLENNLELLECSASAISAKIKKQKHSHRLGIIGLIFTVISIILGIAALK